ncbi:coiled-coil domain-containing protein 192 isoform X4 [Talpa occidentalis]|uniref:coiled-coil domain-containing protein 192 isoform X4 n=1 Tax=Talpa occidentalis TaxID=50954 RepID=UPI0023F6E355|nr:coiled-coil domain-containing protein 192 isoform X4 [Talpa occidentalis]
MGKCYSKKSVVPETETPKRSSTISGSSESDTQQRKKTSKESLDTGQMAFTLAQLKSLEICLKEAEEKAKALSEQCIEKLQAEVKASQEQLTAHKLKHKRKLKKLQTDLATAKQEAAITVLELNEKIKTLSEGKPAPREDNSLEESCGGLPAVEGDRKISLIMELSTQVSLQTEKITQLEEVLEEKERKIQQLEAERVAHPVHEVEVSPECLQESLIFFNDSGGPMFSDEGM